MDYLKTILSEHSLILLVTGILIVAAVAVVMIVKYIRAKGLDGIRKDVYQLFLYAEHHLVTEKRLDYVVQQAYELLPKAVRIFVTQEMLKSVIQSWFDAVKDLLDDGKLNHSVKFEK